MSPEPKRVCTLHASNILDAQAAGKCRQWETKGVVCLSLMCEHDGLATLDTALAQIDPRRVSDLYATIFSNASIHYMPANCFEAHIHEVHVLIFLLCFPSVSLSFILAVS